MEPLIPQRADPQITLHSDGWYYFTASEPGFTYIELRRAKTIEGLQDAQPKIVWNRHATGAMSHYIWGAGATLSGRQMVHLLCCGAGLRR